MSISASCCFNLLPPPLDPNTATASITASTMSARTTTTLLPRESDQKSWGIKCVLFISCTILGLEMGNDIMNSERYAATAVKEPPSAAVETSKKAGRWSDKRGCPPWNFKSYETIVPENLPRPSAHRKWEAVGYSQLAPSVLRISIKTKSNCFSM
ncbi:hypothetical protein Nepgr_000868 [Nepenthes gracilis]|uniref:Uncharacterized protein n=1 Tax=Nepenthes gracilis TaxID=150966 RepID=A0AAD3RWI6_NEPGR|nr:hypothetical protein Nepgr_000868 [Nepenthes gracilis]